MINYIVIDDEEHAIDVITHYMGQLPTFQLKGTYTSPLEALEMVHTQELDLIFLDIHMPELSGIDFIHAVQGKSNIILTTAYPEFAIKGFDLGVVDYLVKPISLSRFLQAMGKAMRIIGPHSPAVSEPIELDYFMVKTESKGKMIKINIEDIEYVEAMKNYVSFYHKGVQTLALLTMKDVEERLPPKYFVRVQKSFIVSIKNIVCVNGNQIELKNIDRKIALGETYKAHFLTLLKEKLLI